MTKTVLLFVTLLLSRAIYSQFDPELADIMFKEQNYLGAIEEYKKHLKVNPLDPNAMYFISLCYLETRIDKTAAIGHLEKLAAQPDFPKETYYYLAQAYTYANQFEKALESLDKYRTHNGKHSNEIDALSKKYLYANQLMSKPIDVTFTNLGKNVNSEYPDYFPFVSKDESILVYTSRRKEGKGKMEFDGYYPSDIFVVHYDGIQFKIAKPSGSLNTVYDEQCVGIYDDGSKIFVYIDNIAEVGEIYEATLEGGIYGHKRKIKEGVNTKHIEISASISNDQRTLFYSSNRPGGVGGYDIYMTRKMDNGDWAKPQNVSSINTPGNETFPSLSPDGKTLYFTSDTHPGMGGYDLFKAVWNPVTNEWSEPENLGFPINTAYDDKTICFADDHKHAYVCAVRPEGFGDWDIYRVTFNAVHLNPVLYLIEVEDASTKAKIDAKIFVYDQFDEPIGEYIPNKSSKRFTLMLEPGEYSVEIEAEEYGLHVQKFVVSEFDGDNNFNHKTIKIAK